MLYIMPNQLPTFYDTNRVLQLLSDTDTEATLSDLSNTGSAPYALAIQACRDGSAEIDQHCQQGKRYLRADLEAIITAANAAPSDEVLQKRAAALRRLAADLTFYFLMARRGFTAERMRELAPRADAAYLALEQLANGLRIFDLDANLAASIPKVVRLGGQVYQPSRDNRMFGVWPDGLSSGYLYSGC